MHLQVRYTPAGKTTRNAADLHLLQLALQTGKGSGHVTVHLGGTDEAAQQGKVRLFTEPLGNVIYYVGKVHDQTKRQAGEAKEVCVKTARQAGRLSNGLGKWGYRRSIRPRRWTGKKTRKVQRGGDDAVACLVSSRST